MGLIADLSKRLATWSIPPAPAAGGEQPAPRRSLSPASPQAGAKDLQTELAEIASLRLKILSRRTRNDADRQLVSALYKSLQPRSLETLRPPEEIVRIQDATRDPLGDIGRLTLALKREPEIGGRILAIARATAAKGSNVRDVKDAVLRVGPAQTGALFIAFLLRPRLFQNPNNPEEASQRFHHCVATALSLQVIAERAGLDRDAAFFVGLLHDAGEALIDTHVGEVVRAKGSQPGPDPETVRFLQHELHAIFSALIAEQWRLPRMQVDAILHHEAPNASQPDARRLAHALALADRIAEEIRPSGNARTDSPGSLITSAFSLLKITGIREIAAECRQAVELFDASESAPRASVGPAPRASLVPTARATLSPAPRAAGAPGGRPTVSPGIRASIMPIRGAIPIKHGAPPSEPPPPPKQRAA